jgi:hypothetical protein
MRGARITHTDSETIGAYVAWNGATVGLAWNDVIAGQRQIFFQTFAASGAATSSAQQVSRNDLRAGIPAIRPWRAGFAIAWNEYRASQPAGHDSISESRALLRLL